MASHTSLDIHDTEYNDKKEKHVYCIEAEEFKTQRIRN
jgi:hypothetical protein